MINVSVIASIILPTERNKGITTFNGNNEDKSNARVLFPALYLCLVMVCCGSYNTHNFFPGQSVGFHTWWEL
jgi:hypothetical protein